MFAAVALFFPRSMRLWLGFNGLLTGLMVDDGDESLATGWVLI